MSERSKAVENAKRLKFLADNLDNGIRSSGDTASLRDIAEWLIKLNKTWSYFRIDNPKAPSLLRKHKTTFGQGWDLFQLRYAIEGRGRPLKTRDDYREWARAAQDDGQ